MFLSPLKNRLIDGRTRPVRILRGPFRGATICMSLRDNLRKVFGVYEHELNGWIEGALQRVDNVLDVGANDGYFTFGCAAALHRTGKTGHIIAFEPQADALRSVEVHGGHYKGARAKAITFSVEQTLVGKEVAWRARRRSTRWCNAPEHPVTNHAGPS